MPGLYMGSSIDFWEVCGLCPADRREPLGGLSAQHSPGHRVRYLPKAHSQQLSDALGSDAGPKRTICWEHPALSNANGGVGRQLGAHMHQELLSVYASPSSEHLLRRQPEGSAAKVLDLWLPPQRADEKQEAEGRSGRDRVKGLPGQFHLGSRSLPALSSCFYSHPTASLLSSHPPHSHARTFPLGLRHLVQVPWLKLHRAGGPLEAPLAFPRVKTVTGPERGRPWLLL